MPKPADIESQIDALFGLPLSEFTGARNALASRLKKEGRPNDADRVKAMSKPSAPAWAVNQLYWQSPRDMDRLLTAGDRVRKAQAGGSGDLRELLAERKELLVELMSRATEILRHAGGASEDALRRTMTTLESLAAYGHGDGAPPVGRLTADLEPLGFDAFAELMGGARLVPARVLPFRTTKPNEKKAAEEAAAAKSRALEAMRVAEKAVREARRDAERAEAAMNKASARVAAIEKQKQEIELSYAEAREEASLASREAKKAAQAVAEAERALERARAALR